MVNGLRRIIKRFSKNRVTFMAAAICFYAFFAIFPFTLMSLVILSYFLDPEVVQESISAIAEFYLLHTNNLIEENLERMMRARGQVGLLSAVALFWSASGVFASLRISLNRIWEVTPRPAFWRGKLLDLATTSAFLLLLALTALGGTALRAVVTIMAEDMPTWLRGSTGFLFSTSLTGVLFAAAYHVIPNINPRIVPVLAGGAIGAIGFELTRYGFTWYLLTLSPYDLVYGSLGTIIAFLFWIYISITIFLFGATVAETIEHFYPTRKAVPLPRQMQLGQDR